MDSSAEKVYSADYSLKLQYILMQNVALLLKIDNSVMSFLSELTIFYSNFWLTMKIKLDYKEN